MLKKNRPAKVKATDTDQGEFEAIVATYDMDSVGDKIVPGAFAKSLDEWSASGDPIPIVWSHMHNDPFAHIGHVVEAKETDEGLWVKGQMDLDNPTGRQVFKLVKGGRIRNYSFAYEVRDEAPGEKGENLLKELGLFEVGPTLIGANRATRTTAAKSAAKADYTGGMVALHPADPDSFVVDGGDPPGELHVTLAFLGDDVSQIADTALETVQTSAENTASGLQPIEATVAGYGQLGDADPPATVLFLNGPGLDTAHADLWKDIDPGAVAEQYTPWIPHMTLGYGVPPEQAAAFVGKTVKLDRVAVHLADVIVEYPLAGSGDTDGEKASRPVAGKAGRVLSAKNETDLRTAADLISGVLAQLEKDQDGKAHPAAPAKPEAPARGKGEEPNQTGPALDDLVTEIDLMIQEGKMA